MLQRSGRLDQELTDLLEDHEDDLESISRCPVSRKNDFIPATKWVIEQIRQAQVGIPKTTPDTVRNEIKKLLNKLENLSPEAAATLGSNLSALKERCSALTESRVKPSPAREWLGHAGVLLAYTLGVSTTPSRSGIAVRYLDIVQTHAGLLNQQGKPLHDSRQIVRDFCDMS